MNANHEAADDMAEFGAHLNVSEGGYRIDTHRVMSCSGPCDQGRKACPCPDQCLHPEPARELISADTEMFIKLLLMALLSVLLCVLVVHWIASA